MKLRTQLLLVMVALSLVPLGVVSFLGIRYFRADKESFIFALGAQTAPIIAGEVGANARAIADRLGDAGRIATSEQLSGPIRLAAATEILSAGGFVAASVHEDGRELIGWKDSDTLERVPNHAAALDALRMPSPLPERGEIHVSNATRLPSLPLALVAVALPSDSGPMVSVAALVGTDRLFRPGMTSAYHTYVVDGRGRALAHPDPQLVAGRTDLSHLMPVEQLRQGATGSSRYPAFDDKEVLGSYSPVPRTELGVIQEIPVAVVFGAVKALLTNAAVALLIVLSVALLAAFLVSSGVSRPISQLATVANAIGRGGLDTEVTTSGGGEVGDLADAFRSMQKGLAERDAKIQQAQEALVQSEKMGALGQLAAGITHEVKNPMAGILGFAQLSQRIIPKESPAHSHLQMIEKEAKRAKEILENLLRFARKEKMEMEELDPASVVDEAVKLLAHQLQINKVALVKKDAEGLPVIMGNGNQLQQVLMNLMMNASQAMQPKGGRLEISTSVAGSGHVLIEIKDEGHGIKEADRNKLFTPFFTTRERGKGTGLGLSVSYGIIKQHQGDLKFWSQEGVGTIFYIYLPPKEMFRGDPRAA